MRHTFTCGTGTWWAALATMGCSSTVSSLYIGSNAASPRRTSGVALALAGRSNALFSEGHTHKAAPSTRHRHRQHYIPSTKFLSLSGPVAYHQTIDRADEESITVIKWGSNNCRACRAASAKLNGIAAEYSQRHFPEIGFYSMDLGRSNSDMLHFFEERNVTHLPYIEVYAGSTLLSAYIIPASRVDFLSNALQEAYRTAHTVRQRRVRRSLLVELRRNREKMHALAKRRQRARRLWAHIRHMRRLLAGEISGRRERSQDCLSMSVSAQTPASKTAASARSSSRRRQLIALRRLARKHDDLLRERQRLERRRHLVHLLMVRPSQRQSSYAP